MVTYNLVVTPQPTIVTKYVAEHKLNKDMSNEELSQHAPELLELLTDKLKRDKNR